MSAVESLSNENALCLRLIRSQAVPHDFWLWLSGRNSTPLDQVASWIDPRVLRSIQEIIQPNLIDANEQQRTVSKGTDAWIAAILGFANRKAIELTLTWSHPMMAVCILPLYRSLATRNLPEAVQQTRNRLSEMLVLIGIAEELGDDFVNLLHYHGAPVTSPYAILDSILKIDLVAAGMISQQVARVFDPELCEFDQPVICQSNSKMPARMRTELAWSDPQLLWQIASELIAKNAEIVLPRQWADVAVPWTSSSEHWQALTHFLALSTAPVTDEIDANEGNTHAGDTVDEVVSEMIDDLLAMQADVAEVAGEAPSDDLVRDLQDTSNSACNLPVKGRAHEAHGSVAGEPRMDAADSDSEIESDEEFPETDLLEEELESSVYKVAILEIHSNTDTLFVNIMRRQVATARHEDQSVCLVALCVESDDAADRERIAAARSNGLLIWQEKLVNWLAEHPQVREPFAFVTAEGQLVISMQDIERTTATNIVREGLIAALTGRHVDKQGALARVAIPARYYAGIGSACPNAGFAAEQLIEATWRCLSAAQNQGKATIKSIEVF